VVESVKAASDVYAPVAGEVIAANADVEASPESVNKDAYSAWMFKMKPANPATSPTAGRRGVPEAGRIGSPLMAVRREG
jgi:glycine cleavage system H lipoate-binding protein